jgi:hypothetical protein
VVEGGEGTRSGVKTVARQDSEVALTPSSHRWGRRRGCHNKEFSMEVTTQATLPTGGGGWWGRQGRKIKVLSGWGM